jgi:PAS domain S-box-containing protein
MRRLWHWLWRSSIRRQLIVGVALVHMLLMTLFVFDLVHRQREFLQERAQKRVQSQARLLAANGLHGTLSRDLETLTEIVAAVRHERHVRQAMITDREGRVLAHTDPDKVSLFRNDQRALAVLQGPRQVIQVAEGSASMEAAAPIVLHDQLVGWAWITNDLTDDQLHLAYVTRSGLLYTAAAILIGTLFAMLLARTVTRPLRLLLAGTERLAGNQLDEPVPVTAENEIGRLTERFNAAMRRLAEQQLQGERSAEALRQSESLYRAIARNIPNGSVWVVDRELRCLVADGGLLYRFGRKRGPLEGSPIQDVFDGPLLAIVEPRFRRAFAGETTSYETEYRGRVFWAQYLPLRSESGEVTAVMVLALDFSERMHMEQDLRAAKQLAEEASRAKSAFLANMSHELRTPMTVIMSSLEYLLQTGPSAEQRHILQMADNSANRLLGVIDDLLEISRIEAGRLKISERPFDLRDCVRQAVEMFTWAGRKKGLCLHWEVAPQVPELVHGDPDRIGQVLVNLLGNAVKFTDRGEVTLTVAGLANGLQFTIRDSGIGIPAEKMELLFQPFSQVDSSLTRRHGGTGLGLAICKKLVGLMRGTIRVESEEGRGSTFFFSLPLPPVQSARPSSPAEIPLLPAGRPRRILLAEDDQTIRTLLQTILQQRRWEVVTAENGRQAVARWQEGGIDLVLMDLQMPEMSGLEAIRAIRNQEAGDRRTPIIVLSAHVHSENREASLAAGVDGFLPKPIRMGDLFRVIEDSLEERELQGEEMLASSRYAALGFTA